MTGYFTMRGINKLLFCFIITSLLISSCCTLFHQPTVNLNVHSDVDSVKFCINSDVYGWCNTPAIVTVPRSKQDLLLYTKRDSVQKIIRVKSRLSNAFWFGNLYTGGLIGYGIDLTNHKRYTYPRYMTINLEKSKMLPNRDYVRWILPEKGLINIKLSVPEGNHLYINKGKGYGNSFGFLGISGGIEYYFTDKYCINTDIGTLTDFMLPVPAPIRYEGIYDRSFAIYGDVQVGSDFKRLHYDVGLQFNRTKYYEYDTLSTYPVHSDTLKYYQVQKNIGLALSTAYKFSNGFSLGINYYPSVNLPNGNVYKVHYSHLIFFELIFKLEALRPNLRRHLYFK